MGWLKQIAGLIGLLRALPQVWRYRAARRVMGETRAFPAASERVAAIPGYVGLYTRRAFYRHVLEHVGQDTYLGFMTVFSKPQARIGDRAYIGRFCSIGWADIGEDVLLADGVQLLSGGRQHGSAAAVGAVLRDNEQQFSKVTIGRGAWLGAGAIVMADVGAGAVVAAGAVVVKPVGPGERVGGVPARALPTAPSTPQIKCDMVRTGEASHD
jgi:acetyltransferase-like isoleucine patch superfamily enzyme